MLVGKANRIAMAAGQRFSFIPISAAINRAYRMDHILCRQISACCDDRFPRRQAANLVYNLPAFGKYCRSAGLVNSAIDSATAEQRRVRGIDDCARCFVSDIGRTVELNGLAMLQQEANCEVVHVRIQADHFLSVSASTPGSFRPSRNSSEAPPPVEMWVILLLTPAACTAATESPPPTMEVAPGFPATALATATVPVSKGGVSKTPIGPFQTIV